MKKLHLFLIMVVMALFTVPTALAAKEELPEYTLTFTKDMKMNPEVLQVKAGKFRLILINETDQAVEFESVSLHREKVLGPNGKTSVVLTIKRPGQYEYFDDFHQGVKGVLLVVENNSENK